MPVEKFGGGFPALQVYYVPPAGQAQNVFTSYYAGFLQTRMPAAQAMLQQKLAAMDPSSLAAARVAFATQQQAVLDKELDRKNVLSKALVDGDASARVAAINGSFDEKKAKIAADATRDAAGIRAKAQVGAAEIGVAGDLAVQAGETQERREKDSQLTPQAQDIIRLAKDLGKDPASLFAPPGEPTVVNGVEGESTPAGPLYGKNLTRGQRQSVYEQFGAVAPDEPVEARVVAPFPLPGPVQNKTIAPRAPVAAPPADEWAEVIGPDEQPQPKKAKPKRYSYFDDEEDEEALAGAE